MSQKFDLAKALESNNIDWEAHAREQHALAARRLELLREAKDAIKHGYYSKTLLERIDEALGDEN